MFNVEMAICLLLSFWLFMLRASCTIIHPTIDAAPAAGKSTALSSLRDAYFTVIGNDGGMDNNEFLQNVAGWLFGGNSAEPLGELLQTVR